jgi:hypothetical protein
MSPDIGRTPAPAAPGRGLVFAVQYVGSTSLTVRGPHSGRIYQFAATGTRLEVDPRDWLRHVPGLVDVTAG